MARNIDFHIPLETLTTPRSGECIVDSWWMVHPEHGALFSVNLWESSISRQPLPMANYDQRITNRFLKDGYEAVQVRVAFISQAVVPMKAAVEAHKASQRP